MNKAGEGKVWRGGGGGGGGGGGFAGVSGSSIGLCTMSTQMCMQREHAAHPPVYDVKMGLAGERGSRGHLLISCRGKHQCHVHLTINHLTPHAIDSILTTILLSVVQNSVLSQHGAQYTELTHASNFGRGPSGCRNGAYGFGT